MSNIPVVISSIDLDTIKSMSGCNFAPGQIALQLGIKKSVFLKIFNDLDSDAREAYEAGKLETTMKLMEKQKLLAEGGNITAHQIFMKESERIDVENLKCKIYFGDE
jgi:hypothetical protein